MSGQSDLLTQFSTALTQRIAATKTAVVAIRLSAGRHLTGMLWRPDIVVTSEQSLANRDEFEVVTVGGSTVSAKVAGRDPGTNIAILKLPQPASGSGNRPGDPQVGAIVLAIGADGDGGVSARLGSVNTVGSEWYSSHGGRLDQRIMLDIK